MNDKVTQVIFFVTLKSVICQKPVSFVKKMLLDLMMHVTLCCEPHGTTGYKLETLSFRIFCLSPIRCETHQNII